MSLQLWLSTATSTWPRAAGSDRSAWLDERRPQPGPVARSRNVSARRRTRMGLTSEAPGDKIAAGLTVSDRHALLTPLGRGRTISDNSATEPLRTRRTPGNN